MALVKATREGLEGKRTALGWIVSDLVSFVALPSVRALSQHVRVRNTANDRCVIAEVLDVGRWNEHDDNYVFGAARPQAESGTDSFGRATNGAGIDLGQKVWLRLGMTDNGLVDWEFVQ